MQEKRSAANTFQPVAFSNSMASASAVPVNFRATQKPPAAPEPEGDLVAQPVHQALRPSWASPEPPQAPPLTQTLPKTQPQDLDTAKDQGAKAGPSSNSPKAQKMTKMAALVPRALVLPSSNGTLSGKSPVYCKPYSRSKLGLG